MSFVAWTSMECNSNARFGFVRNLKWLTKLSGKARGRSIANGGV